MSKNRLTSLPFVIAPLAYVGHNERSRGMREVNSGNEIKTVSKSHPFLSSQARTRAQINFLRFCKKAIATIFCLSRSLP